MQPPREHRSERPAVWDVSNPVAPEQKSLRSRLSKRKSRAGKPELPAVEPAGAPASLRRRLVAGRPKKSKKK